MDPLAQMHTYRHPGTHRDTHMQEEYADIHRKKMPDARHHKDNRNGYIAKGGLMHTATDRRVQMVINAKIQPSRERHTHKLSLIHTDTHSQIP